MICQQEVAGVDFLHKYAWTKVCITALRVMLTSTSK